MRVLSTLATGVGGSTNDAHDQSHTIPTIIKDTPFVHGAQQLQLQTSAIQVNRSKQYKYKTEKPFVDSMPDQPHELDTPY